MKIAIYTICKNEEAFVARFMESAREADGVFVTDTGSSDDTVRQLKLEGATVNEIVVMPWRFDVARNISLSFVPEDYDVCVCIDLDEVLSPGWRDAVEASFKSGNVDRLRYKYVWNTLPDGREGTTFWYDKIHTRNGFRWVKPVHEVMTFDGEERQEYNYDFTLYHYPDASKSRGSYLGLLELAVREEPHDDRSSHYLGREYMYYDMNEQSINELLRHLSLPSAAWKAERAASMRFIGRCYDRLGNREEAHHWFLRACAESPIDREPWVELGKHYYSHQDHLGTFYAMSKALQIVERPASYICEPFAWDETPYDLLAVSAWPLGLHDVARDAANKAFEINPNDERLGNNIKLMS